MAFDPGGLLAKLKDPRFLAGVIAGILADYAAGGSIVQSLVEAITKLLLG